MFNSDIMRDEARVDAEADEYCLDGNPLALARFGRFVAWRDGPRTGFVGHETVEQAKAAFMGTIREQGGGHLVTRI